MDAGARYLITKQSVDDRALNADVFAVVAERWPHVRGAAVLELGGGAGTMLERLASRGVLTPCHYTIVDLDESCLKVARERAKDLAVAVELDTVTAELEDWLTTNRRHFDVIIANAVLDLLDLDRALPRVLAALAPGGTFWFSINFDGETIFEPALDGDDRVIAAYHGSMGQNRRNGRPHGDARTGRRLFHALRQHGAAVLGAGSSDWVVFAHRRDDGTYAYPHLEAEFLRHIVSTIELELRDDASLEGILDQWVATRNAQIDRGELVYIAHQLDFVGTR